MSNYALRALETIRKNDEAFEAEMFEKHGAATFCCECQNNTHVGLVPFWHFFRRSLCERCGPKYAEFLKKLGAWPE